MIDGKRNYIGIPKVLEGFGLPSPWYKSVDDLVDRVLELKKETLAFIPYQDKVEPEILKTLTQTPSKWCLKAVKSVLSYLYERYGRFPVYYSTFHSNLHAQVHHLDTDFYDKYLKKDYLTAHHRKHFEIWHKGND